MAAPNDFKIKGTKPAVRPAAPAPPPAPKPVVRAPNDYQIKGVKPSVRPIAAVNTPKYTPPKPPVYRPPAPKPPVYRAPAPKPAPRSTPTGGGGTGGGGGGGGGDTGGGGGGGVATMSAPAPIMETITIPDAEQDEYYKQKVTDLARAMTDFKAQQGLARSQYDVGYGDASGEWAGMRLVASSTEHVRELTESLSTPMRMTSLDED